MHTRQLGRTGRTVSRLGLGLAALGRPGYINLGHATDLDGHYDVSAMQARAHAVLDAAWAAGVRYFDAARSYGRAELFLATWLKERRILPDTVIVGSKWGYTYTADWQVNAAQHEVKDHSLDTLRRQMAESRALLGEYLDLYQIHSATLETGVLDDRAVIEELARWRDDGIAIGLTLSGAHQADTLRRAMEIAVAGVRLFDCVQATWNLLEQSAGAALQAAHDAGMGVIIKEALANGRLTARNRDPAFAAQRTLLERCAADVHTTLDGLALAAVLAQPWADTVLSGAATVEHLCANLGALSVTRDVQLSALSAAIVETPESYWKTRSHLAWN